MLTAVAIAGWRCRNGRMINHSHSLGKREGEASSLSFSVAESLPTRITLSPPNATLRSARHWATPASSARPNECNTYVPTPTIRLISAPICTYLATDLTLLRFVHGQSRFLVERSYERKMIYSVLLEVSSCECALVLCLQRSSDTCVRNHANFGNRSNLSYTRIIFLVPVQTVGVSITPAWARRFHRRHTFSPRAWCPPHLRQKRNRVQHW